MSDYPMLISNKLHSFRNFTVQNYNNLRKEKETHHRIRNSGYSFRNSSTIVIEYRR